MPRNRLAIAVLASLATTGIASADDNPTTKPSGAAIYEAHCARCHQGGFGGFFTGAPKVGKKKAWQALIPQGLDALTARTINGTEKMAARGECETCTDAEIRAAVEYMVEASR